MIGSKDGKAHKNTEQFAAYLAKLDVDSFFGVCKILKIQMTTVDAEGKPDDLRPFEDIWGDMVEKFNSLGRYQRRELLDVIKKSAGSGK